PPAPPPPPGAGGGRGASASSRGGGWRRGGCSSSGCGRPRFGICFGHQLFGRALGFGTYKLKYGHRGINQPVQDGATGGVEVTAHNHGLAGEAPLDGPVNTAFGRAEV
ncbi:hypothetical protein ADL08_13960, partial [Streptomyces sp. NRRL F-6492]